MKKIISWRWYLNNCKLAHSDAGRKQFHKLKSYIDNPVIWSEEQIIGDGCNWGDAFKFAEKLNADKHLNRTDWRVPKRWELLKACDEKVPGFKASYYWSSSGVEVDSSYAWSVDFSDGDDSSNGYKDGTRYVRCVASGL